MAKADKNQAQARHIEHQQKVKDTSDFRDLVVSALTTGNIAEADDLFTTIGSEQGFMSAEEYATLKTTLHSAELGSEQSEKPRNGSEQPNEQQPMHQPDQSTTQTPRSSKFSDVLTAQPIEKPPIEKSESKFTKVLEAQSMEKPQPSKPPGKFDRIVSFQPGSMLHSSDDDVAAAMAVKEFSHEVRTIEDEIGKIKSQRRRERAEQRRAQEAEAEQRAHEEEVRQREVLWETVGRPLISRLAVMTPEERDRFLFPPESESIMREVTLQVNRILGERHIYETLEPLEKEAQIIYENAKKYYEEHEDALSDAVINNLMTTYLQPLRAKFLEIKTAHAEISNRSHEFNPESRKQILFQDDFNAVLDDLFDSILIKDDTVELWLYAFQQAYKRTQELSSISFIIDEMKKSVELAKNQELISDEDAEERVERLDSILVRISVALTNPEHVIELRTLLETSEYT